MSDGKGALILQALKARLETIKESAGYSVTVKDVWLDQSKITMDISEGDLPMIEIINERESYKHGEGAQYWAYMDIILRLVAKKSWTDSQMENFKTDIRKALYGGASDASGNTGITLNGTCQKIELVDSVADLNMIESNRIYLLKVRLHSRRTTFRD